MEPTGQAVEVRVDPSSIDPALGAAFRAVDEAAGEGDDSRILAAKARGLMIGYHARWAKGRWDLVADEPVFHLPIINPATGYRSHTFTWAGRCHGVVARDGRTCVLESKTAAEDLGPADAPVWRRLAVDTRAGGYALARRQQGRAVGGILYDVVRRPGMRPRVVPKGNAKRTERENVGTRIELERQGTYFGRPVDERQQAAPSGGDGRETPDLYALRIAADTLRRPAWYFQRRVVRRSPAELTGYGRDLWQAAVEIRLARRAGRHYRNSDACTAFHTPCPYLPLCSGRDTVDSDRWQWIRSIHCELGSAIDGVDERSVLTHSCIQCFKLCRRKHYFRYEMGIVPANTPPSKTLSLSRLIHRALAAWWRNRDPSE
jgi:hypothetical protein